jgi:molecular chaperone HscB
MHPPGHPKTRAEGVSALINEAYKTLANPLLRAQYLLSLRGVDVATDETMQVDDPALLMVVLEAHEEISDAHVEEDLRGLRTVNDERISKSEDVLERAFHEDDVLAAKKEAVKLRYWVNIKQSLDDWEEGRPVVLQH